MADKEQLGVWIRARLGQLLAPIGLSTLHRRMRQPPRPP